MDRTEQPDRQATIFIFIICAREDHRLLYLLLPFMNYLEFLLGAVLRTSTDLRPGAHMEAELLRHIESADVLLLLISPDLLASPIYTRAISLGLERARRGELQLFPILARPISLERTPLASLQLLPRDGRALSEEIARERALLEILHEVLLTCRELQNRRRLSPSSPAASSESRTRGLAAPELLPTSYRLDEVFKRTGLPTVTFVPPSIFEQLKLALVEPGRSVVIEGPSGIGKTTAVQKAVQQLGEEEILRAERPTITFLSARAPADRERLRSLSEWHRGVVIIDDFHRLEPDLRQELVDYLKLLADTQPTDRKLVIIGIPGTGQSFVSAVAFDTAMRFDRFKMGRASDEEILQLIRQGEQALNVMFERKEDILRLVDGSFILTQFLCYYLCVENNVLQTQPSQVAIRHQFDKAVQDLMGTLEVKFDLAVKQFAIAGGPYDQTSLTLLEELRQNREGVLWLSLLQQQEPGRARDLERFFKESWSQAIASYPPLAYHLFCDPTVGVLLAEDPTLIFYLRHCNLEELARKVGKRPAPSRRQIFICYARQDKRWLERLRIHLAPLEQKGVFDLWDDTLISAGSRWEQTLEDAILRAGVAIVLVSADFLASEFIQNNQLPKLLERARLGGTLIIPIIVSPCLFEESELHCFQPALDPQKPLAILPPAAQEQTLVSIARRITAAVTEQP
ncbi:MAG: TIR domain-containing protein [Thermogemmatispora sp.]|uniref:TIR domain-containing protein n=1 Tax=Thermogemmatispora sp. TaxID=1968838 RepID=UPI00262C5A1C|nr:TIR domain-containing protein [Thermogemmatispora sp.]MBX5458725.1 TIR domain-containing protein [Thermogemmatispora sp.]